jgi:molybdopterin-binding protein
MMIMARSYRLGEVAEVMGTSVDTVRRWVDAGRLASHRSPSGQRVVEPRSLARFVASTAPVRSRPVTSARNHLRGVVTRVVRDRVVTQVEIQAGQHRLVSVITREAADDMGLVPGVIAEAVIKATNVGVELTSRR